MHVLGVGDPASLPLSASVGVSGSSRSLLLLNPGEVLPLCTGLGGSARLGGARTDSGFRRLWEERGRREEEERSRGCRRGRKLG